MLSATQPVVMTMTACYLASYIGDVVAGIAEKQECKAMEGMFCSQQSTF